jgi:hypothetical protein
MQIIDTALPVAARLGVAAMLGLATAAVPAAASPAVAAPSCSGPSIWLNGEGAGTTWAKANLKKGPYAACTTAKALKAKTTVYYQCAYQNAYGNIWLYVRVAGTSTTGWIPVSSIRQSSGGDDDGDGTVEIAWCS